MIDAKAIWEDAKKLAREAIDAAFAKLPGTDGKAREDFAVQYLDDRVEQVDQLLPVIGQYMDLPPVDFIEKEAIRQLIVRPVLRLLVRQQFAALEISKAVAL